LSDFDLVCLYCQEVPFGFGEFKIGGNQSQGENRGAIERANQRNLVTV
jgi:hypothetical protein